MAKHYDKQFKLDAVQYYHDHKNLGLQGCATNLGISQQTLSRWQKELRETGDIESRGSGNYASDEAKEIARLKRELRDAQDALEAVSYTHLFVKLQLFYLYFSNFFSVTIYSIFYVVNHIHPVSYTHLDVYKRQRILIT